MNWSAPAFESLAGLLGERTGLVFIPDRRPGAEAGIRRAMGRAGTADPARYRGMVAGSDALLDDLLAELTVGETYFYREPSQFEFLRREVLPAWRGSADPLRAWSAACASGEEAYSLAMLFRDEGLCGRGRVLATDICRAALARAARGNYGAWSLRGEGANDALPHLRREAEGRYSVVDAVRRLVTFAHLNLALDVYPSSATGTLGVHLIFCRNVLIYFDRETVASVAARLSASLAEGGWLVTASSDPPLGPESGLEPVVTEYGVFYRRARAGVGGVGGASASIPAALPSTLADPPESLRPDPPAARDDPAGGRSAVAADRAGPKADDPGACASHVRALANLDPGAAAVACADASARHPLCAELHYLRAVLLVGLGRDAEAAAEARRVLYLDRTAAVAHVLLGSILLRRGDSCGARRAYRNARDLCAAVPPTEVLPLSDGEPAGRLWEMARLQLERLEPAEAAEGGAA